MKYPALIISVALPVFFSFSLPNIKNSAPPPKPNIIIKPSPTPISSMRSAAALVLPTHTPVPSKTPRYTTRPAPAKISTPTPAPSSAPVSNIQADSFIQQINDYRASSGLPPVSQDSYTCNFAKLRAQEIASGFNHDGFSSRMNNKTLPYPSYRLVVENIAMNNSAQDAINQWINSSGHAANLRADILYACVQSFGNYYAYEAWKP